jgi:hypothetical protein
MAKKSFSLHVFIPVTDLNLPSLDHVSFLLYIHIVTDLINALSGNSSVNTVQHGKIEEAVLSVDPTDAPIDWLDSDHVICVYCRSMSVSRLYNESRGL